MKGTEGAERLAGRTVDRAALAERVRAARDRAGLTQVDLAREAGVSQPTLSRVESGERGVSLAEADALATALAVPLDILLYGSAVQERVLVALRAAADVDSAAVVGPAVELLELDERLDAVVDGYRQSAAANLVDVPSTGTSAARGAGLAERLRTALEIGAAPVLDLSELIEDVTGVDVAATPLSVSGMCVADPKRQTRLLVVNSDEPAERQRFTLAHELGHLLFGDGAHIEGPQPATGDMETRCNEFARNFLVPPAGVSAWLARREPAPEVSEETVSLLARYFAVTPEVIKIQLERMRLRGDVAVPSTPVLASRYGWRAEYEAMQVAARRPRPPRRLVRRATEAYAAGRLGVAVLARLEGRPASEIEAERAVAEPGRAAPRSPARLASIDTLLALAAPNSGG